MGLGTDVTKDPLLPRRKQILVMARLLLGLLFLSTTMPALAGSATAQSIWKQGQAMEKARQQVPTGATVTGSHCSVIDSARDTVWTCTVMWDD
jgi:hypothetical protein